MPDMTIAEAEKKLEPCPTCKGKNELVVDLCSDAFQELDKTKFYAWCRNCEFESGREDTLEELILSVNRRAT